MIDDGYGAFARTIRSRCPAPPPACSRGCGSPPRTTSRSKGAGAAAATPTGCARSARIV